MRTDYLLVVKPWIVGANLVSAAGGFFLAAGGQVAAGPFLPAMLGIACLVAAACVCNNCIDRRLDAKMARTRQRPLATGALSPAAGLAYAGLLGLVGLAVLAAGTNVLTVAIVLAGFGVYVGLYSLYLKRHSLQATRLGSLAGAAPPVAAYCAVRGRFDGGALILLALFSLWQIPHAYAIAIVRADEYAAAAVPVLPLALGVPATRRHIVRHIVAFAFVVPLLTVCGYAGQAYLVVATAAGLAWLLLAWSGHRDGDARRWARRLYVCSILVIAVVSLMMACDGR